MTDCLNDGKKIGPALVTSLMAGERVVVHCKGGLGRAGTVASMLLLDTHTVATADEAMLHVRAVRQGAIETSAQEKFLREWAERTTGGERIVGCRDPIAKTH